MHFCKRRANGITPQRNDCSHFQGESDKRQEDRAQVFDMGGISPAPNPLPLLLRWRPLNPCRVHRRLHAVVVMKQLALLGFRKSSAIH
jgi:hypothetical protein